LANFTGQIVAALVVGNTVVANQREQTSLIALFVPLSYYIQQALPAECSAFFYRAMARRVGAPLHQRQTHCRFGRSRASDRHGTID